MNLRFLGLGVLALSLAAAGCGGAPQATPTTFMSPGKPRPSVSLAAENPGGLFVGVPATLVLELRVGRAISGGELLIEGDEGLEVLSYSPRQLPPLGAGESRQIEVRLTPSSGGSRRLTALVALQTGAGEIAAPLGLELEIGGPVTVTPVAAKPLGRAVRNADGESVISVPAEVTVSDR